MKLLNFFTWCATVSLCSAFYACSDHESTPSPMLYSPSTENTFSAIQSVEPLFNSSETIEQLADHLDDIRQMESIEDAWVSESALFLKVKNAGTIFFLYPAEEKRIEISNEARPLKAPSSPILVDPHKHSSAAKAVLVNQQVNDGKRSYKKNMFMVPLSKEMERCGISVKNVEGGGMTLNFLKNELFDYDFIFIITHGVYDEKTGLHWLMSGEEVGKSAITNDIESQNLRMQLANMYVAEGDSDQISVMCVKEQRGNSMVNIYYKTVSEVFFRKQGKGFAEDIYPIIYTSACESQKKQATLGEVFIKKGAGCFGGWNEGNHVGDATGYYFFLNLLSGCSVNNARLLLPNNFRKELYKEKAPSEFILWVNYTEQTAKLCLFQPECDFPRDISDDNTLQYLFEGWFHGKDKNTNKYGFFVSTDYNMKTFTILNGVRPGLDQTLCTYITEPYYHMEFKTLLTNNDLELGKTYYICSYLYDGKDYCMSLIKRFCAGAKGELGLFDLRGPVHTLTNETAVYVFNQNGILQSINGISPSTMYDYDHISRDEYGRIKRGYFDDYEETYEEYTYNGAGRKKHYLYNFFDTIINEEYTYDEWGNVKSVDVEELDVSEDIPPYTITYRILSTDLYDNWTSREVQKGTEPVRLETRTITYYEE